MSRAVQLTAIEYKARIHINVTSHIIFNYTIMSYNYLSMPDNR